MRLPQSPSQIVSFRFNYSAQTWTFVTLKDALKGFFLIPTSRLDGPIRCVTHGKVFEGWMEASFHQTLNLGCKFETVKE